MRSFCLSNLQISDEHGPNELVVEPLEFVAHIVVARFADNVLNAGHQMVDEALVDAFVHGRFLLVGALHIQELDQRLDGDALQEHRKVDDRNRGGHEHWLQRHVLLVDEQDQRKGHSTAKSSIGHYKLIDTRQLVQPKLVGECRKYDDPYRKKTYTCFVHNIVAER